MKKNKKNRVGSEEQYGPRTVGEIPHIFFENSNELWAVAYRDHIFNNLFPHTEPCCRLKLLTRKHGRMPVNECLNGCITHLSEDNYLFIENAPKGKSRRRNPCVYKGYCFNVHKKDDGTLFPTFRQPHYTRYYTFKDFCRESAEELLMIAGLVED